MTARASRRILGAAFAAGGMLGVAAAFFVSSTSFQALAAARAPAGVADELATLKAAFRRPAAVPFPADNPYSEKKRALGAMLFHDTRLSMDGSRSCASCHDRSKGFADGKAQGQGVPGRLLKRHTPTLWNLAWAAPVFWDGRARSLEEQVAGPIESPDEMAQPMASVVERLAADPAMRRAFAEDVEGKAIFVQDLDALNESGHVETGVLRVWQTATDAFDDRTPGHERVQVDSRLVAILHWRIRNHALNHRVIRGDVRDVIRFQ